MGAVKRGPIRSLAIQFGHFVGGNALGLLLGLATFPILTRALSRQEYGILGLVTTTASFAVAIAKGGLSDGIVRFFRQYAENPDRLSIFASTVVTRGIVFSVLVAAAYAALLPLAVPHLGVDRRFLSCFYVMTVFLLVRPLNMIVLNVLRAQGATLRYNVVNVSTRALGIVLAMSMLFYFIGTLAGYFVGIAAAEAISGIVLFRWLFKEISYRPSRVSAPLARDLIHFGLPLLLTELSYLGLSYVDRYMIVAYNGEDILGLYSVGYNLPSYINDLLMFSLSYAVVPIYTDLFASEGRAATEAFLSRALHYYLIGVTALCAGYFASARDLIVTLASVKYTESAVLSPLILVGLVCLGLNSILGAGLYLERKSRTMLVIMLVVLAVNIAMNALLLPKYGATGAAVSRLLACVLSMGLTAHFAFPYVRLRLAPSAIAFYLLASTVMYASVAWIETGHAWLNLIVKVALGTAIVTTAALWREDEVRAQLRRLIAERR